MVEMPRIMYPPRAPNETPDRKGKVTARLWRVFDSTLFQMILVAALLATVLGDCGPPPNLHFAALSMNEYNKTSYKDRTRVPYSCRPGYVRTSSKTYAVCDRDNWHYDTFCVKRKCSNPGELRNGEVIMKPDYSFGSHIEFNCLEGKNVI